MTFNISLVAFLPCKTFLYGKKNEKLESFFSIITPAYNSRQTIYDTICSVIAQQDVHVELIVVDGGSTDKTLDIVQAFEHGHIRFISEPDNGIYDAMNKGLKMARGRYLGILNSDDYFVDPHILRDVEALFEKTGADTVYGDLNFVDPKHPDKIVRHWRAGSFKRKKFLYGWMPPHPVFFVRRECYEQYGYFDLRYRSSADYELMLRFLYKYGLTAAYLPRVLAHMRTGGQSNASWSNRLRANREDRAAWKNNGLKPLPVTTLLKPIRKIPQFWVRKRMLPPAITLFPGTQAHIETESKQVHRNNIV